MANQVIPATARPQAGKGAARSVRREGKVPAVIYGEGKEAIAIAIDANELGKTIAKGKFLARLFDVDVGGITTRVIPREVQLDPVRDFPLHVDFLRVGPGARIRVQVPCRFINEAASPGLKRGGVLNVVRHEVEVFCPAETIPNEFVFDLTGLEIGRSIHISATKLPDGVKTVIQGRDFTVATIAGAVAEEEKAATTTEAAAGDAAAAAPAADGKAAAPAAGAGKDAKAGAPAKDAKAPAAKK